MNIGMEDVCIFFFIFDKYVYFDENNDFMKDDKVVLFVF